MVVEGFSDAAVEFARETGISSTIDQDSIQERMEIREAVADGRVEEAVRRVNELDPEVSLFLSCNLGWPQGYEPSCTTLSRLRARPCGNT